MTHKNTWLLTIAAMLAAGLQAGPHTNTVTGLKDAGRSAVFFDRSYTYAVFPSIGQGGLVIGGAMVMAARGAVASS